MQIILKFDIEKHPHWVYRVTLDDGRSGFGFKNSMSECWEAIRWFVKHAL